MSSDLYDELAQLFKEMLGDGSLRFISSRHAAAFEKHGLLKTKGINLDELNRISDYCNEPMRDEAFGRKARSDLTRLAKEHWEHLVLVEVLMMWATGLTGEEHLRLAIQEFVRRDSAES